MRTSIIRPGILVALKSTVAGGVQYRRVDLETGRTLENGAIHSKWETERTIQDPEEHERAIKVRGKALAEIRSFCSATSFGLLCPEDREAELGEAVARARAMVDAYNESATCTRVAIYCLKGRIASTDEEAARAIAGEVRSLLDAMDQGISKLDVEAIRDAATRAASMGAMLGEEQVKAVSGAVEAARKAARQIVKRVEKKGEATAAVLADIQKSAIDKARFAFLDLDDNAPEIAGEPLPAVPAQRFAALDVEAEEDPAAPESAPESAPNAPDTLAAASA